jgi:Fringe-like
VIEVDDDLKKFRLALKYIDAHYSDEFDWIFKVTDTSYIIVENLRHLLYQYDTDWPLVIGQRFLLEVRFVNVSIAKLLTCDIV